MAPLPSALNTALMGLGGIGTGLGLETAVDALNYPRQELFKLLGAPTGQGRELVRNWISGPMMNWSPTQEYGLGESASPEDYLGYTESGGIGERPYNAFENILGFGADVLADPMNLLMGGATGIAQKAYKARQASKLAEEARMLALAPKRISGLSTGLGGGGGGPIVGQRLGYSYPPVSTPFTAPEVIEHAVPSQAFREASERVGAYVPKDIDDMVGQSVLPEHLRNVMDVEEVGRSLGVANPVRPLIGEENIYSLMDKWHTGLRRAGIPESEVNIFRSIETPTINSGVRGGRWEFGAPELTAEAPELTAAVDRALTRNLDLIPEIPGQTMVGWPESRTMIPDVPSTSNIGAINARLQDILESGSEWRSGAIQRALQRAGGAAEPLPALDMMRYASPEQMVELNRIMRPQQWARGPMSVFPEAAGGYEVPLDVAGRIGSASGGGLRGRLTKRELLEALGETFAPPRYSS